MIFVVSLVIKLFTAQLQALRDLKQGWAPRPAGNPPRGEGGVPRPAPHCGEGGVPRPDPPRKNDQNRGEVAGQNKGPNLNFFQ